MKEVFEQLAFIKPMLNADDPKVQWAGLWSLICTLLWTEAYKLINTIKEAEKANRAPPFYTKIIQSKGYYEFAKLTKSEKDSLNFK